MPGDHRLILTLFLFLLIVSPGIAQAQPGYDSARLNDIEVLKDSLYKHYLSDTLQAAKKIDDLVRQALDEKGHPSKTILRFQLGMALVPYAGDSVLSIARLYAEFSSWLLHAGASELAITYAKTALDYGKKVQAIDPGNPLSYHLNSRVSTIYTSTKQADSAWKYSMQALAEAKKLSNPIWTASAFNNAGYVYEQFGSQDSALKFFNLAMEMLPLTSRADSDLLGSIRDNIAENYLQRNVVSKAYELFRKNEDTYKALQNDPKLLQAKTGILRCALANENYADARLRLEDLERVSMGSSVLREPQFRLKLLEAYKLYYEASNQWQLALLYNHRIKILWDSLNDLNKRAVDNIVRASIESEVAKANKEVLLQKILVDRARDQAFQNLMVSMMVALLAVAVITLIILYFRNRNRIMEFEREINLKELEYQHLKQEKLEQALQQKKSDLQGLGVYLSEVKDLHSSISNRIKNASITEPRQHNFLLKEILKELEAKTDLHERAALIQQNIDKVNAEFYNNLLKRFPTLTKSEVDLCGLLKLNLSNKEIGALKNISAASVKMARNRLRKKIGIDHREDIYAFMASI